MTDIVIQAGEQGVAELRIDGVPLEKFIDAVGIDLVDGQRPRVVLEGGGRLRASLEKVEIGFRRVPPLTPDEFRMLEEARSAYEDDEAQVERFDRIVAKLQEIGG